MATTGGGWPARATRKVENAERLLAAEERDPEHHANTLLPENRIRNRGRVDAIEYHGRPGCRDAPGESGAEWYPNALADLLLDAARGTCDKLVGGAFEHQHRGGIGVQYVAHPCEQLRE